MDMSSFPPVLSPFGQYIDTMPPMKSEGTASLTFPDAELAFVIHVGYDRIVVPILMEDGIPSG